MFLSGYMVFGHIKNPLYIWILDKVKRLVLPFLGWAFVYKIIRYNSDSFTQYFINLFEHPDLGLWFLWVLFLNYCVLSIVFLSGKAFKEVKLLLTIIILYLIPIEEFGFYWVKWLFPFFAIGYIINEYKTVISELIKNLSIFLAAFFPFLVYFWHRTEEPAFNLLIYKIFSYMVPYIGLIDLIYKYLVAFAGISLFAQMIKNLEKYNISLLSWLGTYTLDIYVSHQLFLWGIGGGIMRIISTIVISLSLSLALLFCLRQSKILSMIFLGQKYSRSL
jgi:fucose 4-O-acetylase-like acetyltransferase